MNLDPFNPTIRDLMADPLIRSVMKADHVDPVALEALLRSKASGASTGPRFEPRIEIAGGEAPPMRALVPWSPKAVAGLCGSICTW